MKTLESSKPEQKQTTAIQQVKVEEIEIKEARKQHLIDIMHFDEEKGLYDS